MPHCLWFHRDAPRRRHGSRSQSSFGQQSTSIHILDDDTLFHVFSYCRLTALDHHEFDDICASQWSVWEGGFWWYTLVKVCRRWRCLIFGYAFHFGVGLPIRGGMQMAGILARTPPLPLGIDHCSHRRITAQEKDDLLLALQHRDRVRAIRLQMQVPDLRSIIVAMGGEFPILECLVIALPIASSFPTSLILPATFHAPRLRRLKLPHSALPILPPSPSLTAPTSLVKLSLLWNYPPTYPCPGTFLQLLSSISCLEMLQISFDASISHEGLEWPWLNAQAITRVTFPNLRRFTFEGDGSFLEAFLPWIKSPLLEKLHISFFHHSISIVPHLLSFLGTFGDLGFANVKLTLGAWYIFVQAYNRRGVGGDLSLIYRDSRPFSQKIAAARRIINSLGTLLPTVEHLTLQCETALGLMGLSIEHDRTQWCSLLRPFDNVKTLLVDEWWTGKMSRFLPFRHGEPPMDLLPELKELMYCTHQDIVVDAFTKFTEARRNAGRPVTLVRHQTSCGW